MQLQLLDTPVYFAVDSVGLAVTLPSKGSTTSTKNKGQQAKFMNFSKQGCYLLFSVFFLEILIMGDFSWAMELSEEKKPVSVSRPTQVNIVSPEGVYVVQQLRSISSSCPKVAQTTPQIDSAEDYRNARKYFELSKKYNAIISAAAVYGMKPELIEESQRVLSGLKVYNEALHSSHCLPFRSAKEEKELETDTKDIDFKIACNHLMSLVYLRVKGLNLFQELEETKKYVGEIKRIKASLSSSPEYLKQLQQQIQTVELVAPELRALFHPETAQQQPSQRPLGRIDQQRQINQHQKITNLVPEELTKELSKEVTIENFDPYFHITSQKILTEFLSISFKRKKIPSEEYISKLQTLAEEFIAFENEGAHFRTKLLGLNPSSEQSHLKANDLAHLYKLFCERYTLPHKNPLQLLENCIFLFIHTNKVDEALTRVEVLRTLLLEKGPLSDNFIYLRASVLALNGDFDEWRFLLKEKRRASEEAKAHLHQQRVEQIKQHLEGTKKNEAVESERIPATKQKTKEKEPPLLLDEPITYPSPPSVENLKSEIVTPRLKQKTRKPSQNLTQNYKSDTHNNNLTSEPASIPNQQQKVYYISNNAYKTYRKIREGNDKFSRKDLYNLFEKLDCEIDISQGKGDHGKIAPPLNMMIQNKGGLVAVIPEFGRTVSLNNSPLPLTVPNWDEKWDGRAPPYMMKSILKALDYLGAMDEAVFKQNDNK